MEYYLIKSFLRGAIALLFLSFEWNLGEKSSRKKSSIYLPPTIAEAQWNHVSKLSENKKGLQKLIAHRAHLNCYAASQSSSFNERNNFQINYFKLSNMVQSALHLYYNEIFNFNRLNFFFFISKYKKLILIYCNE